MEHVQLISASEAKDKMYVSICDSMTEYQITEANSHILKINEKIKACIEARADAFTYELHYNHPNIPSYIMFKLVRGGYIIHVDESDDDSYHDMNVLHYQVSIR